MPQNYPYSGQQFTNNILITGPNPKIAFGGTETGALYFETVEVAGTIYFSVQNASFNEWAQQWVLVNPGLPAFALAIINGTLTTLKQNAFVTPFTTWINEGSATGQPQTSGSVTTVAADGSAPSNVTYSTSFQTSTNQVLLTIRNNFPTNNWHLSAVSTNITASGFSIYVTGGPSGSTVQVDWFALGT